MDEKHLRLISGIDAEDWEQTPASVRQLVVQLGLKIEQLEQDPKELQNSKEGLEEKVNKNSENSPSPNGYVKSFICSAASCEKIIVHQTIT